MVPNGCGRQWVCLDYSFISLWEKLVIRVWIPLVQQPSFYILLLLLRHVFINRATVFTNSKISRTSLLDVLLFHILLILSSLLFLLVFPFYCRRLYVLFYHLYFI